MKAANFNAWSLMVIPLKSGFEHILFSNGSRVRTDSSGEKGTSLSGTIVEMKGIQQVAIYIDFCRRG